MSRTTLENFGQAGIAALVRAGEAKQWFFGHFGATMIAGTRLLRNPNLPGPAGLALSAKLSGMLEQHQDWYAPLSEVGGACQDIEGLLEVLRTGAATLRTSGHSTIYIASALHVLSRDSSPLTDRIIDGLIMLHESGRDDHPGRYYGVSDYFEAVDRESPVTDQQPNGSIDAFRMAIASLDHLVPDQAVDGRHYFLTGEKIHLLTHAHAIATLEGLGFEDIATRALEAQSSLARFVDSSRELAASTLEKAERTPFDAAFWEQDVQDPAHLIKVAEAVVAEIPRLPEEERGMALERMRGVWSLLGIR